MSENFNPLKRFSYKEQVSRAITWGHYFIFINILLACLLGFSYVYAAPPTTSFLSFFYLIVSWLGHMSFLTVVVYLVIFFPLAFIGNFRYYRVLCVCIAVIMHTILLFDIKIYLLVKVHLSMTAINLIVRELDFDTGLNYNFLFIAVPILIALECVFAKITTHSLYRAHHPYFVRTVLIIVCSCFVTSHVLHIWADATKYDRITLLRSTFPAHYPMTARSFLSSHGWLNEKQLMASDSLGAEYINYPLTNLEVDPHFVNERPANVLLITLNGLSYSNLSKETTPQLLAFKEQVQSFDSHYLLYKEELNNVFAMTYGLPLQYRQGLFAGQMLPVTLEEMFKQDYVSRVIVSALKRTPQSVLPSLEGMSVSDVAMQAAAYQTDTAVAAAVDADPATDKHTDTAEGTAPEATTSTTNAISVDASADAADADAAAALARESSSPVVGETDTATANATDTTTTASMLREHAVVNATWLEAPAQFDHADQEALRRYFSLLVQNSGLRSMQFSHVHNVHEVFAQALQQIREYRLREQRPYALSLVINDLRDFDSSVQALLQSPQGQKLQAAMDKDLTSTVNPMMQSLLYYELSLEDVDQAFGKFMTQLRSQGLLDHTLVIVTAAEGNKLLAREPQIFDREVQHVPLMVLWPQEVRQKPLVGSEVHNLSSPQDLSATIAREILHVTTSVGNFSLGASLKELPDRPYVAVDGVDELILVGKENNIIYSMDGSSYIENNGERLPVRPNLENLIEATRDLNRFLR